MLGSVGELDGILVLFCLNSVGSIKNSSLSPLPRGHPANTRAL